MVRFVDKALDDLARLQQQHDTVNLTVSLALSRYLQFLSQR